MASAADDSKLPSLSSQTELTRKVAAVVVARIEQKPETYAFEMNRW
jgi:hypothetical protein